MNWSEYSDGRWQAKKLSKDKESYQNDTSAFTHYFLGWVDSIDQLHISVHNRIDYFGPEYLEDTNVANFVLDSCQGEVVTSGSVSTPVGEVTVVDSYTSFNHRLVNSLLSRTELSLEIVREGGNTPRDVLSSISSTPLRVDYASQYGFGGSETSPFFFSEDERAYFVRLKNTVFQTWEKLSRVGSASRLPSARTALPNPAAQQATLAENHYGGVTDQIISRDTSQTELSISAQQTDLLGRYLGRDDDAETIPPRRAW